LLSNQSFEQDIQLDDVNPIHFFGVNNINLNLIKQAYPEVRFIARGSSVKTIGDPDKLEAIARIVAALVSDVRRFGPLETHRVIEVLDAQLDNRPTPAEPIATDVILHATNGTPIRARTAGQSEIVEMVENKDLVFAIGPAGSGKTYTAVALAVRALKNKEVKRIVLCRPAVEAGERLGFLPGDIKEKIDPYLRPLYDALQDMIPNDKLKIYMEKNIIEIAPLAYMRGRTLNNSFIILDEAQNATETQLKMLLTRMGMGSKVVVTGDRTQIDLPKSIRSGLFQCIRLFESIPAIGIVYLNDKDVVRHPLIKQILKAYEQEDARIMAIKAAIKAEAHNTLTTPPTEANSNIPQS
jgi:phosphate starvation-inducible protein PhoH and related proteins